MENTNQQKKSATSLLKEYLASVSTGNPKLTASYFAPDGWIDAPYVQSLGMPSKYVGHKAIENTMTYLLSNAPDFHFKNIKIIMKSENEVVAEYESEAVFINGRHYKQLYIGHLTSKDGKIVSHKEYLNMLPFVEAFYPNGLKDLITNK